MVPRFYRMRAAFAVDYVSLCNASVIEPEAQADFRLNDSGDRLAPQAQKNKVFA